MAGKIRIVQLSLAPDPRRSRLRHPVHLILTPNKMLLHQIRTLKTPTNMPTWVRLTMTPPSHPEELVVPHKEGTVG